MSGIWLEGESAVYLESITDKSGLFHGNVGVEKTL